MDGLTDCNPGKCKCAGGPRAIHLLHVGSRNLNSLRGMQRFLAGREDQSRGTGTRHHVEWRAAAPKLGKSQPPFAPWCHVVNALPSQQAEHDLSELPPLPEEAVEAPAVSDGSGEARDEEGDGFPAQIPCHILPRWGSSDSPCMTLGVSAQGANDVRSVHV